MDHRTYGMQKRARTGDVSRNEGDWTCPQCGNVNFAFRNNCNLRKCNAPKPSYPTQGLGKPSYPTQRLPPMSPIYDQKPSSHYMGSTNSVPSQMSLGMPPTSHGVPMGVPSAGGLPYDYHSALNVPPAYGNSSIQNSYSPVNRDVGYRPGMVMDGSYGMNYGTGRGQMLPSSGTGYYPEENVSRKRKERTSEGDWTCPKCGNTNFAFRTTCNMRKCGTPKPTIQTSRPQGQSFQGGGTQEGSWTCSQCGNLNYSFRTKCNRKSCGAEKTADSRRAPKRSNQ